MHPDFNSPGAAKITGRRSTMTGMFFAALTPVVDPTDEEVREALLILEMREGACVCAYCGGTKSEWDHFRPITVGRKPTGYITEIANLVPSCGKCNQSKGNKPWREWIRSKARHSPARRGIPDIDERVRRLEAYERWRRPTVIEYEKVLGKDDWSKHIDNMGKILELLAEAEGHAEKCRAVIRAVMKPSTSTYAQQSSRRSTSRWIRRALRARGSSASR